MVRNASAHWSGAVLTGSGTVSTESGVLEKAQYSFTSRFESGKGTNPEELLGAAHAGCFSMALSAVLGGSGFTPDSIETTAAVSVVKDGEGFTINKVHLVTKATIPGITAEQFDTLAHEAKANCPVSKLFHTEITLDASLA